MNKICKKCGIVKKLDEFRKQKNGKFGRRSCCKECEKIYRIQNKEKRRSYNKKYNTDHKEYFKAYRAKYKKKTNANNINNKEYMRTYYIENKEKININRRISCKERYLSNPTFRLNNTISSGICRSLKNNKNGRTWPELVGYTLRKLKKHLEKQFKNGMTWSNYGKWHVDHKIPISVFNFTHPEHIDFKRCWALKNLQPMWAKDNISKSNKLDKHFQPSLLF